MFCNVRAVNALEFALASLVSSFYQRTIPIYRICWGALTARSAISSTWQLQQCRSVVEIATCFGFFLVFFVSPPPRDGLVCSSRTPIQSHQSGDRKSNLVLKNRHRLPQTTDPATQRSRAGVGALGGVERLPGGNKHQVRVCWLGGR